MSRPSRKRRVVVAVAALLVCVGVFVAIFVLQTAGRRELFCPVSDSDVDYAWLDDRTAIVLRISADGQHADVIRIDQDGRESKIATGLNFTDNSAHGFLQRALSPDASELALFENGKVHLIGIKDGSSRFIPVGTPSRDPINAWDLLWDSATGDLLVFVPDKTGMHSARIDVWDSTGVRRLKSVPLPKRNPWFTADRTFDGSPLFARNGKLFDASGKSTSTWTHLDSYAITPGLPRGEGPTFHSPPLSRTGCSFDYSLDGNRVAILQASEPPLNNKIDAMLHMSSSKDLIWYAIYVADAGGNSIKLVHQFAVHGPMKINRNSSWPIQPDGLLWLPGAKKLSYVLDDRVWVVPAD